MAQFSLSWDAFKQNICSGLSSLQQNGEFVDMTLAADGHHVKVHQMVLSLASPYIKELILSAQCPHPVIFLNKMSYPTLSAILEYIYTGEVMIGRDHLKELVEAARELHIKGLQDMKMELATSEMITEAAQSKSRPGQPLSETAYFKRAAPPTEEPDSVSPAKRPTKSLPQDVFDDEPANDTAFDDPADTDTDTPDLKPDASQVEISQSDPSIKTDAQIQYTTSNQGSLQMILNRCIYYLRYTSRKGPSDGHRQWKCIDYIRQGVKCPATVITQDDVVIKRFAAHNHPFHDRQILKKVQNNTVYSAIHDAEAFVNTKKMERQGAHAATDGALTDH